MANTSTTELLERCLTGASWSDQLLQSAIAEDSGRAFFRIVVERLGDSFEPTLCDVYAKLFARVIELVRPDFHAAELTQRYERVRRPRVCTANPKRVFVLSRVTLGADVAVTSIVLDGARRRFPEAEIVFVGPRKNWELFAGAGWVRHQPFAYARNGSMQDRLSGWPVFDEPDSIVLDPDSRLSQLGLLPVCPEENYHFFESRAFGGDRDATLVELTREWVAEVLETAGAKAWVAPEEGPATGDIAVSFGVGDNPEKRLDDTFEENLLRSLAMTGASVLIDEGAGGEETERVRRLCERVPEVRLSSGPYAPFAHAISRAKLYVGYDSAGQHVAAACGTPLISVFAGYPAERMFQRWHPDGPGRIDVLKVTDQKPPDVLAFVLQNLTL